MKTFASTRRVRALSSDKSDATDVDSEIERDDPVRMDRRAESDLAAGVLPMRTGSKCGVACARRVSTSWFALLALLLAACGDDGDGDDSKPSDAGADGGAMVEQAIDPAITNCASGSCTP